MGSFYCINFLNLLISVLVRVSTASIKHHELKQLGEKKVYLAYTSIYSSSKEVRTGQQLKHSGSLEAGAEAELMGECCL